MPPAPRSPNASPDAHSRREWLRAGGLTTFGLSLPQLLAGRSQVAAAPADNVATKGTATFGRAKRCLVLFMFGAPAHQDLWDLKIGRAHV